MVEQGKGTWIIEECTERLYGEKCRCATCGGNDGIKDDQWIIRMTRISNEIL